MHLESPCAQRVRIGATRLDLRGRGKTSIPRTVTSSHLRPSAICSETRFGVSKPGQNGGDGMPLRLRASHNNHKTVLIESGGAPKAIGGAGQPCYVSELRRAFCRFLWPDGNRDRKTSVLDFRRNSSVVTQQLTSAVPARIEHSLFGI